MFADKSVALRFLDAMINQHSWVLNENLSMSLIKNVEEYNRSKNALQVYCTAWCKLKGIETNVSPV